MANRVRQEVNKPTIANIQFVTFKSGTPKRQEARKSTQKNTRYLLKENFLFLLVAFTAPTAIIINHINVPSLQCKGILHVYGHW